MSKIQWDKSFSVDAPMIDAQHMKWIAIINNLHDSLLGKVPASNKSTGDILDEMIDYTHFHFSSEEAYIQEIGYPGFDSHVKLHSQFNQQLLDVREMIRGGDLLLFAEEMEVLMYWLKNHILHEDMKYSDYKKLL